MAAKNYWYRVFSRPGDLVINQDRGRINPDRVLNIRHIKQTAFKYWNKITKKMLNK